MCMLLAGAPKVFFFQEIRTDNLRRPLGSHFNHFPSNPVCLVPAPTTEEAMVVLPTNAPYETKFGLTTTYYWPNFELNATAESLKDGTGYSETR